MSRYALVHQLAQAMRRKQADELIAQLRRQTEADRITAFRYRGENTETVQ